MIYKYLSFSISIAFISWIVGMLINAFIRKTDFYHKHLNHLNFIKSEKLNKIIGLPVFKWIVKNTFFKFFNQKLKLTGKIEKTDLIKLRAEMTTSEIDHLIAFIFVTCFALVSFYNLKFKSAGIIMFINVLMNLYPSLLQQENKRRIDKFIHKF
ncbi:hypothetical protein [Pedobacter sp. KLB.chiD]|uniref:glycosyl-4,4'-diaponeurosporenoate acyltransferase CrtO family protein n=1 Tax=Pedobacter sp. KLB.chiD TaxID=3387402 RepID=UPI00399BF94F